MSKIMRVVSGIQPTGNLHLGNYLGAIVQWVKLQDQAECYFFLADLHAVTVYGEPELRRSQVREMAAALLACGLDAERVVLFNQARVSAHAELAWLLNCTARMGWLNRMTQFKDKAGKNREASSIGLYAYPVLQAADVLLYQATHVPVGEDQKQHLELARDIADKFNHDFAKRFANPLSTLTPNEIAAFYSGNDGKPVFTLPEPMIGGPAARVMSLRDGKAKMSKSDASDASRINLTDSADEIAHKIRRAKTDPLDLPATIAELEDRPEAMNLLGIYAALSEQPLENVVDAWAGRGFGTFKTALTDLVVEKIAPIATRFNELKQDNDYIDQILIKGSEKARRTAAPTLAKAYHAMGLFS